jgi:hypothetical protein
VHLLVWLNDVAPGALVARAADVGVGIYPVTPYLARAAARYRRTFARNTPQPRAFRGTDAKEFPILLFCEDLEL